MIQASQQISLGAATEIRLFREMKTVPDTWDHLAPKDNIFLQRTYLQTLEDFPPEGMAFAYLIFYGKNKPIGIAIAQIQMFRANENIQDGKDRDGLFTRLGNYVKEKVAEKINFYTLVCGNLLLTGEHGFYFLPEVDPDQQIEWIYHGFNNILPALDEQGINVSAILIKEVAEKNRTKIGTQLSRYYQEFTMQPNMLLPLDEHWTSLDQYTEQLSSKYRVRMKRALKKGKNIQKIPFDLETIIQHKDAIHELYCRVAKNADFNSASLHPDYFPALKKAFPDAFQLTAYYLEAELIGYYTTIHNHDELEAHFLGFDYDHNRKCQTYLNFLFDIIKDGINNESVKEIVFARTALEIKSSVGAEPEEMYLYARHRSSLSNRILQPMVTYLQPKVPEWVQRNPFRNET